MKKASDYLSFFKNTLTKNDQNKEILKKVINDYLGVIIPLKQILIKDNIFYIESDSVTKNEILFNKEKIIDFFHKKGGSKEIKKIK